MRKQHRRFIFENLVGPIVKPIFWTAEKSHKLLFGWADTRACIKRERQLQIEVRQKLSFLFGPDGGTVVPNVGIPFPEPFDYATVTVAYRNLFIRIVRGRGELNVDLATAKTPGRWFDLITVIAAVNGDVQRQGRRYLTDMDEVATILSANAARLNDQFGLDPHGDVGRSLAEFHKADQASMREWEFQINSRLP